MFKNLAYGNWMETIIGKIVKAAYYAKSSISGVLNSHLSIHPPIQVHPGQVASLTQG